MRCWKYRRWRLRRIPDSLRSPSWIISSTPSMDDACIDRKCIPALTTWSWITQHCTAVIQAHTKSSQWTLTLQSVSWHYLHYYSVIQWQFYEYKMGWTSKLLNLMTEYYATKLQQLKVMKNYNLFHSTILHLSIGFHFSQFSMSILVPRRYTYTLKTDATCFFWSPINSMMAQKHK